MDDILVVAMTLGFFAVCLAYVALCDRIVGPDEPDTVEVEGPAPDATVATEVAR